MYLPFIRVCDQSEICVTSATLLVLMNAYMSDCLRQLEHGEEEDCYLARVAVELYSPASIYS
jgi:hypothetical protein